MAPTTPTTGTGVPATGRPTGDDPLVQVATALALPFTMARQLLPDNPLPVLLGTGALATQA